MKKPHEVADALMNLPTTEERLKLIYMWVKQGVVHQRTFIQAISLINLADPDGEE